MKQSISRRALAAAAATTLLVAGSIAVAAPASAEVVGVCTMNAQNPHASSHVSGTINGVGTASCTVVMNEIYVHTVLERADGASWAGNTNDYFNTSYEQSGSSQLRV